MNNTTGSLPEIVFDTDTGFTPDAVAELVKQGQLLKLGPKLYTSRLDETPELVVRRNIFAIAGHFWPGAVVSWRTAFEEKPAPDGSLYLSYHSPRKVRLPGHTLKLIKGPGPLAGDRPYTHDLHRASLARAFLENIAARRHEHFAWGLSAEELEQRLGAITDPDARQQLHDRARELAVQLEWPEEFEALEELLRKTDATAARGAKTCAPANPKSARASTPPANDDDFDAERLRSLETLFGVLRGRTYRPRPRTDCTAGWHINRAFFEAYFSNYLAGLEFDLEAAHQVIVDQKPLAERPMDSTVLLNNFNLLQPGEDLGRQPKDGADLLALLASRHERLFVNRSDEAGGCYRQGDEQTDATRFITAGKVRGTLLRGFDLYRELQEPFTRAAFMMFLVRECHPFSSGSGRVARATMNAELTAGGEMRILIPPVYCGDYWLGLRSLTRDNDPEPFVNVLMRAHAFSAAINFETYQEASRQLHRCNALMPPDQRVRRHEV